MLIELVENKDSFTELELEQLDRSLFLESRIQELEKEKKELLDLLEKYRKDDTLKDQHIVKLAAQLHFWEAGTG